MLGPRRQTRAAFLLLHSPPEGMKLKKKKFGRTDYRLSELCLSASNFSRYANRNESFAILDCFQESGGNLIQTSGICPGVNLGDGFLGLPEELLGRWLKFRHVDRASILIATRFAFTRPVIGGVDTYTELIRCCVEDSIRRIDCGYLDFLVVEWTDAILPVEESMAAFEAVIDSGRVGRVVPANFPSTHVIEGLAAARNESQTIVGLQLDFSLATPLALENGAASLGTDHDLAIIARSPLAGGHLACRQLTSRLGALRNRGVSDRQASVAAQALWPVLSTIAHRRHCSPAQVALSWVLAHPKITSVLVSVSSVNQLRELLATTRLQLASDDMARLGGRIFHSAPAERVS